MSGDPLGILTPKKSSASNDPLGILSMPKKEQPAIPVFMDIGGTTQQTIQTAQQNIPKVQQQPQPKLQGGARDIMAGFGVRSDVTPNQEQQQYLQSSFEATQKLKEENKRAAVENTAALYFENNPIELKGIGLEKAGKKTGLAAAGKEPEKFSLQQLKTASPFNKKVAELQSKLDNGELTIYTANNGESRLAYKADGLTNYIEGLKDAYYAKGKAEKILSMDFDEFKKFIEESKVDDKAYLPEKADQQSTLYGFGQASLMAGKGAVGAAIGSVLAAGAPTTGGLSTAGLPAVMAWAATVPDMATQMQAFSLVDYYNRAKQENPLISDKEAFEMAKNQSRAAYVEQLATGTVMAATGFASLPANTGQGLWKAVGQFAKNQPRALGETGLAVGAGSVSRDLAARQFGFNVTDQEIYDNAYNQIRQEITEDLAFNIGIGSIHAPGYVKAQAKGVLSKMPPEKLEQALQAAVQQGTITEEQAVKTAQGLAEFKAAESKVPETLPEEKRNAIAGLFEQRTKVEQEQKEALARLDPIFHDEVKKEYENQLSAINDKIKAIKDADDIFEFEQDNLTGQKANVLDAEQVVEVTETPTENEIQETQVIQPKADEGTITESEVIEGRLPEIKGEIEPITTEKESIAETGIDKNVERSEINGNEVWESAKKAGSEHNDGLEYYEKEIKSNKYILKEIPISEILNQDPDVKYFVENEAFDSKEFSQKREIKQPIIIGEFDRGGDKMKNGVMDGSNRIAQAIANGQKTILAYVPLKSKFAKSESITTEAKPIEPIQEPKAQPIEQPEQQTQQPTVSNPQPIKEEVSITTEPETQPQEPIIAENQETTIKEQQGKVDKGAKKDLSTRAREYADKLLSGEETVLPDWLQASLPKGTKKQGIGINEAFAQALKAFADIYDTTKNFAQAVDEGFQKIKDWFDENKIPYNEAELKQKFSEEMSGRQEQNIFTELDATNKKRSINKRKQAKEEFISKYGEDAQKAIDINDNFDTYIQNLKDLGIITKVIC